MGKILSEAYWMESVTKCCVFEWYKRVQRKLRECGRCWKKCSRMQRSNKNAENLQNLACWDEAKLLTRCMTELWWGYEKFCLKKTSPLGLCPSLWQCFSKHSALFKLVMDEKHCFRCGTPPLFAKFATHWLLALPEIKVHLERTKISGPWRCSEGCDSTAVGYSERDVHKCSQQWQQHQARCLAAEVGYF